MNEFQVKLQEIKKKLGLAKRELEEMTDELEQRFPDASVRDRMYEITGSLDDADDNLMLLDSSIQNPE